MLDMFNEAFNCQFQEREQMNPLYYRGRGEHSVNQLERIVENQVDELIRLNRPDEKAIAAQKYARAEGHAEGYKEGKIKASAMEVKAYCDANPDVGMHAAKNAVENLKNVNDFSELYSALQMIVEIGKRDMSNPKYDSYFEFAKEQLALHRNLSK